MLAGKPSVGLSSNMLFGNEEQGRQFVWDTGTASCVLE